MTTSVRVRFLLLLILAALHVNSAAAGKGQWQVLQKSIGIVAMHMQLLHNDRVVIFDRTDFGLSNLTLPDGRCRRNALELVVKTDCTAHSIEYDVAANKFRALFVQTDVWCSSGSVTPEGTLVQTGGFNDGDRAVRTYSPCAAGCDWKEINGGLAERRWYASNHQLPDGRQVVVGGRRAFSYEFNPKGGAGAKAFKLPFLGETNDPGQENNLYPFVFLNVDGNLFIFANNRAILLDYNKNVVVKTYPTIPGGDPRSYPSSGSAVLLPLKNLEAEVLICGGAPKGSYLRAIKSQFVNALNTCARIKITDPNPKWAMETMPGSRVMGDMVMLPNGNVLIINGATSGTAGWESGRDPALSPVLYRPNNPTGSRFEVQNLSKTPRMYHSTAILLRDGRVLVAGSNPHIGYSFGNVIFPTELSMEVFSPSYLEPGNAGLRPAMMSPASQTKLKYGQKVKLRFQVKTPIAAANDLVTVTMLAPPFTTHSFSMNQRLLVLGTGKVTNAAAATYEIEVAMPGSPVLAPAGFYLLFVVHKEIPSEGVWIQIL